MSLFSGKLHQRNCENLVFVKALNFVHDNSIEDLSSSPHPKDLTEANVILNHIVMKKSRSKEVKP